MSCACPSVKCTKRCRPEPRAPGCAGGPCIAGHSPSLVLRPPSPGHRLSDAAFDSLRLWMLVALCALRLAVTRPHLQAYLCLAKARVEQLRREAGRIEAREVQRRVGAGPGWADPG